MSGERESRGRRLWRPRVMTCSGPFRGAQGHNSLHDCTGRGHIGWKRGEVVPETIYTTPSRCMQTPCTSHTTYTTYTAGTALTVAHAPHSKLHIWGGWGGLGGWGLGAPGPHGPVVLRRVPKAIRPSKEACGGAAQRSSRTTSPRFQLKN